MKIQYISNTCDTDELREFGEHLIALHNDEVVYHHDHSDGFLDIEDSLSAQKSIAKLLKVKIDDLEFILCGEKLKSSTLKSVKQYLQTH